MSVVCRSCDGRLVYQGTDDCVFNYSNRYLITNELGFDHADSMCEGRVSYSLHFKCLVNRCRHGNVQIDQLMSRGTYRWVADDCVQQDLCSIRFPAALLLQTSPVYSASFCRKILQAFMLALDIDNDDLYTCKLCKDSGETVVMDGKEMGISKALSRAYARPLAADTRVVPVTRSALSLLNS